MTYTKNGARKYKLQQNKLAIKQLSNFSNTLQNMQSLMESLDKYEGILTNENLDQVARLINKDKNLKLLEDQINLVTKKYGRE